MSTVIYQVTDWEQGTISSSGSDSSSSTRIRSVGYIPVDPSQWAVYTVTATDTNATALRTNIMMYDSEYKCVYDSGWNASGIALSDSHNAAYIRIVLSYNSGNIIPSDLAECSVQYDDGRSWHLRDGQLTNENFIPMPELYDTQPDALWRIEDNNLFNKLMPQNTYLGAFANATQLRRVSIPRSCKKIGKETFRNTKLTSVTIARDCVYYPTSFPDGCTINFYPD